MKFKFIFIFLSLITLGFIFIACEKSVAPVDEEIFVKVYAEMIFMQDTTFLSQKVIREKVLNKFKISANNYEKNIEYYNEDPKKWQNIFDKVTSYIDSIKAKPVMDTTKTDSKFLPKQSLSGDKKTL